MGFDPNKLRALIAKYVGIDAERVTDEALDLLTAIEEEFPGTELSDDAVQQIKVVGDLIRYMEINCLLGQLYAQPFHRPSQV